MRVALVAANGRVDNVIVVEDGAEFSAPPGLTLVPDVAERAEPGGRWENSDFAPPPALAPPPVIYPKLTPRQIRIKLLQLGILDSDIESFIQGIPDVTARESARIEWRHAMTYSREHPLVAQIAAAWGLTEQQIDAAWLGAAAL